MLDSLTPESVFAEMMIDESDPAAYLLVEGPDENAIFFGHLHDDVALIVCGGKSNVVGAAEIAETEGVENIYGLVDSDFDDLRGITRRYPHGVVATSGYDLLADILIAADGGLRRVVSAHSATAAHRIEAQTGRDLTDVVYDITATLAAVRLAALRQSYPLIFKRYNFTPVITALFEPAPTSVFVASAKSRDRAFVSNAQVQGAIDAAAADIAGDRRRSSGHDLVGAVVALVRAAGASNISRDAIEGSLIAQASCLTLASLHCIRELHKHAADRSGVHLFDCVAA